MKETEQIRVLHITQAVGGIKTYITGIISASDRTRYEYGVAGPSSDLLSWARENGIPNFPVDFVRPPSVSKDLRSLLQVVRIIRSFKPQVLHAHSGKGGFIGRLAGWITHTPTVFTPNAFSYLGFRQPQRAIYMMLERLGRSWTNVLLAVSESERSRAIRDLGYPEETVLVVPNSIVPPSTDSISVNAGLKNHIGMVGRLLFQKNPEMFLRVAKGIHAKFPAFAFTLLGEGFHDFSRDRVYQLLKDLDASAYVSILKWGEEKDAARFIKSCDIYLLTSHFEGLPFTILEAMAYGVPVVATDVEGARDVITDGKDGFLVEDDDVEGMVEKITGLIESAEMRETISRNARKTITDRFDLLKNVRQIENIYAKLS